MHLIIDIRAKGLSDSIIVRYASNWVDLWKSQHPIDRISYLHFGHQNCPENGNSLQVSGSWYRRKKLIGTRKPHEVFRCVNFSIYSPYDQNIETISHIFDHANILYPVFEQSWIQRFLMKQFRHRFLRNTTLIVPSVATGQETMEVMHIPENNIAVIPYISLVPAIGDTQVLHQLSLSGSYWLYDGTYGSEANIYGLLRGYKTYQELGGSKELIFLGQPIDTELRRMSDLIQKMNLTGSVRILGVLPEHSIDSIYAHASGWIYVGGYYTGGPRIELARSSGLPLLISDIPTLSDYHDGAIKIHPNHLGGLGQSLIDLETLSGIQERKIENRMIMQAYEKILSERR